MSDPTKPDHGYAYGKLRMKCKIFQEAPGSLLTILRPFLNEILRDVQETIEVLEYQLPHQTTNIIVSRK